VIASDKLFCWLFEGQSDHILPALILEAQMAVVASACEWHRSIDIAE
jgi:hypothetical protein